MSIESKEYIKPDGTVVQLMIRIKEHSDPDELYRWEIYDVKYRKPEQTTWKYMGGLIRHKEDFRDLPKSRLDKELHKAYIEYCGEDIVKKAFKDAYEQMMPAELRS